MWSVIFILIVFRGFLDKASPQIFIFGHEMSNVGRSCCKLSSQNVLLPTVTAVTSCLGLLHLFHADRAFTQWWQICDDCHTVWPSCHKLEESQREEEKLQLAITKQTFKIFHPRHHLCHMANRHFFEISLKHTTKPSPPTPLGLLNL